MLTDAPPIPAPSDMRELESERGLVCDNFLGPARSKHGHGSVEEQRCCNCSNPPRDMSHRERLMWGEGGDGIPWGLL